MEVFAWQVSERRYGSKSLGAAQLGDDALAGPISCLDQRLGIWSLELTGLFLNGAGFGPLLSFLPWFGPFLVFHLLSLVWSMSILLSPEIPWLVYF